MTRLQRSLGVDRRIYDAELYDALNRSRADLPFYLACARAARGPVLELCCGTGRITIPLAQAGIDVTGLDFTSSMLGRARQRARQAGLRIRFVLGDMRRASLGRRFNLVFIPFNSIQNTYPIADVERVLANVRRHLAPGGRFVFDIFNPSLGYIVDAERKVQKGKFRFRLPDGRRVTIDEHYRYDAARQTGRVTWVHHIGAKSFSSRLDMRCFYPLEMDALLKYNGFEILRKYGSFRKESFRSESLKQIYVCRASPGIVKS